MQFDGVNAATALAYFIEFGISAISPDVVTRVGPRFWSCASANEALMGLIPNIPLFCDLAVGTQFSVRGMANAAADPLNAPVYAVY